MSAHANAAIVNGVAVGQLFQTIEAVESTPGIAKFKFRIRNQWLDGARNQSTISDFHGAGQHVEYTPPFVLEADEPPLLLGQGQGANPVEYLLHALAACVTTSMVYHAAAKGIMIDEVESSVEGKLDLRGFLGLDNSVRNGYESIHIKFRIKADGTDEDIQEICQLGPAHSPVYDSLTRGVPVTVACERAE